MNVFIYLYAAIGLVPYFDSIDKQYPQNLYLLALNILVLSFYYIKNPDFINDLKNIVLKPPIIILFLFLIWSSFTSFFAVNYVETLATLPRLFNQYVCLVLLIFLMSQKRNFKKFFFGLITVFLILEVISVFSPYFLDIYILGKPGFRPVDYRGFSGNINIMAYLMLPKITLLFYYAFNSNSAKRYFLILLNTLAIFSLLAIFKTRSAIVVLFISCLLSLLAIYKFQVKQFSKKDFIVFFRKAIIIIALPLFLATVSDNYISNKYDITNVQKRVATLANIESDSSLQQRLRYYGAAISSFLDHPFTGIGLGNWELVSLKYENPLMTQFIVPYHAHNDYLEVLAETGIVGFLLYFSFIFIIGYLLLKKILANEDNRETLFLSFLLICFIIHLIDSLFNFPFDRVLQQVYFCILLSAILVHIEMPKFKISPKIGSIIITTIILLTPISIYSTIRLVNSGLAQKILIKEFNTGKFETPSIEELEKMEIDYKNTSQTSMPLYSVIGLYYFEQERYKEAIELFRKGRKHNPYFHLGTTYVGYSYLMLEELDSALHYTEKAFKAAPNNFLFYGHYLLTLERFRDSTNVKKAFNMVKYKEPKHENLYLGVMNNVLTGNKKFALENIDLKLESGNDQLKENYYALKIGYIDMYDADLLYQRGELFYEKKEYKVAADLFLQASNLNPFEFPYKENAANAYMQIGKDSLSLKLLDELINKDGSKSPKTYYLRGLVLYGLDKKTLACQDLRVADNAGLFVKTNLYNILCSQP